jgi:DNA modification methylase
MKICRLADIIIDPNRQRKEFDPVKVLEMQESIEWRKDKPNAQLQHPPVLRERDGQLVLVAGETRLKVLTDIFALGGSFVCDGQMFASAEGLIPYTSMGELSELEAFEAELDENIRRKDLTWQERSDATRKLHDLRTRQAEDKRAKAIETQAPMESPATPAHTIADTAQELYGRSDGAYQNNVRKELIVAQHLHNPAVKAAKSVDEAFKILKKQETAARNVELAAIVGSSFTADQHIILNRNCLGYMAEVAAGPEADKFDVICTDPPYGMGADTFGDAGGKMTGIEHHYDDSLEAWTRLMNGYLDDEGKPVKGWCQLSYQVAKTQAHAYVFCDLDNFFLLRDWMREAGWYVFRTPLVMYKLNSGRVPLPDQGPRRQYETILYAIKGKKPVTHIYSDVISVQGDENTTHGAQKSVALYQNLLQRSVRPGDRVADFFGGTGTLIPAAHGYKCTAVVTELSPEYYGLCVRRIKEIKAIEAEPLV